MEKHAMYALHEEFSQLAEGKIQVPARSLESYVESALNPDVSKFHQKMVMKSGPLFKHFLASLPCIGEELARVGTALNRLSNCTGKHRRLFEADAFDGTFGRTLAEINCGGIESVCCSPNPLNHEIFYRAQDNQWSQHLAVGFDQIQLCHEQRAFDYFYEMAAFQFYGPNRNPLLTKASNLLSSSGVGIFLEKCTVGDDDAYRKNEDLKDRYHKARYFTDDEIEWKKTAMLSRMMAGEVSVFDLQAHLSSLFKYVDLAWQGGNFFEFIVFNDADVRKAFWDLCPGIVEPDYFKDMYRPLSVREDT